MKFELSDIVFSHRPRGVEERKVFEGLNLRVNSGERVGVLGEEGEGKSTLLQLMAGLLRPDSGSVVMDGKGLWSKGKSAGDFRSRTNIGFAFQFPEQQFLSETVEEELLFTSKNLRVAPSIQPGEALQMFGLNAGTMLARSPFSLSLGEARRVALASMFVSAPRALLLDEPTVGLDTTGVTRILDVLRGPAGKSITMVIVSHDVDFLSEVVDRVIVLNNGGISLDSDATDLFIDHAAMESIGYLSPAAVQFVAAANNKGKPLHPALRRMSEVLSALRGMEKQPPL